MERDFNKEEPQQNRGNRCRNCPQSAPSIEPEHTEHTEEFHGHGRGWRGGKHHGLGRGEHCEHEDEHHHGHGRGRWGGHRHGAGRPRFFEERKTITKQIPETTISKIKEFAASNEISENEALDRLINEGYKHLQSKS